MNCRDGDLAYYVGEIVELHFHICVVSNLLYWKGNSAWIIDPPLPYSEFGNRKDAVYDRSLRPIRDSDKQDEMLSIVNLKEKVKS